MRGKCVCLLSALLVGLLVLGACAQTPTATTSAPATSASPVSTTAAAVSVPSAETPKYGGTLAVYMADPAGGFDEAYNMGHVGGMVTTPYLTNDQLLEGDWKKGPAGTGDQDWSMGFIGRSELLTGCLAESWEFPDETTIVFHIRKGVHWQWTAPL